MENSRFTLRSAPQLGMRRSSMGCGEQLQTQEKVLERSSCSATNQHARSQARSGRENGKTAADGHGQTRFFGGKALTALMCNFAIKIKSAELPRTLI